MADKLIAVRIRGNVHISQELKDAFRMLNLNNQHNCVILPNTPSVRGALVKLQGYITFGVGDAQTIKQLESMMKEGDKCVRLHPPRGGFERKGIKQPFTVGGALGDRKEGINELVRKMMPESLQ
jgi:large subunit ribosomal protein L30